MSVGRIFFAWVSSEETFDASVHAREDEQVFALEISEEEGEFAVAKIEVRNPRQGLLSPARRQRCFISAEIDGAVVLLFSGRVVGIPAALARETVELEFIGRPDDHAERMAGFIASLKEDRRYHPALVPEEQRSDLTSVLEGFAALPHWSRDTGSLSLAHVTREAQSVVDLGGNFFEDSLEVSFSGAPLNAVKVELDLSWTQRVPCAAGLLEADEGEGAQGPISTLFGGGRPVTLTADDFANRWPAPGSSLDGGWTVIGSYLTAKDDGMFEVQVPVAVAPATDVTFTGESYPISFPEKSFDGNLFAYGMYEQPRRERISFLVEADLQPVAAFPDPEILSLSAAGEDVAPVRRVTFSFQYKAPSDDGDGLSTRVSAVTLKRYDLREPAMLSQPGLCDDLLFAAMARAEARLRKSARCVSARVQLPLAHAIGLSTASVVRIADDRLPGGSLAGKVTRLAFFLDGDGACYAEMEIGSSVGRSSAASRPSVIFPGYDDPFEPAVVEVCRASGVCRDARATTTLKLRNSIATQRAKLEAVDIPVTVSKFRELGYQWAKETDSDAALAALEEALSEVPAEIDLAMVSLDPIEETEVVVQGVLTEPLGIFRDIDMEG